jgi:hypothetical protein
MQLLHQLIQDTSYDILISIGRRKLALKHHKLVQVEGDFDKIRNLDLDSKLRESDIGGDNFQLLAALKDKKPEIHAFCALGTTIKKAGSQEKFYKVDHDYVMNFAYWTKSLGATKFLYVSAMGADSQASVYYNKVKGEVEEDLKTIPFDYLGLFQPSLLLGNRKEFRFGEEAAKILTKPLVWLKLFDKFRPIHDHKGKSRGHLFQRNAKNLIWLLSSKESQNLSSKSTGS